VFEAIESSPLNQETQNLTDRQREVAERQNSDAALFRDIRSSPRAVINQALNKRSPPPQLDSDVGNQSDVLVGSSDQEEPQSSPPSSPHFGPNNLQSDDQPPSSPLAASVNRKRKHSASQNDTGAAAKEIIDDLDVFDIPSSPPSVVRRSHNLMESHLTEESDIIASTKDNTQASAEMDPDQTPTKRKISSQKMATMTEEIVAVAAQLSNLEGDLPQLQRETAVCQNKSQTTHMSVISLDVSHTALQAREEQVQQQDMDMLSVVEDSFVAPPSATHTPTTEELTTQIRIPVRLGTVTHIQETQFESAVEEVQDVITDSQVSIKSIRGTERVRRRKSPSAVIEEQTEKLNEEPMRKKHKPNITFPQQSGAELAAEQTQALVPSSLDTPVITEDPERSMHQGVPTARSVLDRMRDLVIEARMVTDWTVEDQHDASEFTFEIQALMRGR
jgi:hypothetical protein